jgi:hypothetical protein
MCHTLKNNGPKGLYAGFLYFTKFSNASVFTYCLGAAPNNHMKVGPKDEDRQRVIRSLNDTEGSFRGCSVPEQNI